MVGFIVNPLGMLNLEARFCRGSEKQVQSHKHLFSMTQVPSGHHQLFEVLGPLNYACRASCYFDHHKTYYGGEGSRLATVIFEKYGFCSGEFEELCAPLVHSDHFYHLNLSQFEAAKSGKRNPAPCGRLVTGSLITCIPPIQRPTSPFLHFSAHSAVKVLQTTYISTKLSRVMGSIG
jgi:hypothetical protein